MGTPSSKGPAVSPCAETDKHIAVIKEELLKPALSTPPCTPGDPGKISYFKPEAEKTILEGQPPSSGEIPAAIADEQVYLGYVHLKGEERDNVRTLLCGAVEAQDAYASVNYCLALMLQSESAELPKLMSDLSKMTAESAKEFPVIAEKIKKAYDQICTVKTAFNAMQQCIDKVCNADEKKKLKDDAAFESLYDELKGMMAVLMKQGEQAVMSVVQAASVFALNNVAGLESLVAGIKGQAEAFKKDIDANTEAAGKKAADWHKKYAEATTALISAQGGYGKSANIKRGKEGAYCFMNQTMPAMSSHKKALLDIFNPATKDPNNGN